MVLITATFYQPTTIEEWRDKFHTSHLTFYLYNDLNLARS